MEEEEVEEEEVGEAAELTRSFVPIGGVRARGKSSDGRGRQLLSVQRQWNAAVSCV